MTASAPESTSQELPNAKHGGFMRGWSSEERNFARGSVIVAGIIPGAAAIVILIANHAFGAGMTP